MTAAKLSVLGVDVVCTKYERGSSIRELAQEYGYSYTGMRDMLVRNDVTLRSRGGSRKKRT